MAPPFPRRSSRARTTNPQSQQSSVSSSTSGRLERNTRSLNKPSSGKSTPSASLSSEPLDEPDNTLLGRRRKRGPEDEQDKGAKPGSLVMTTGSEDVQEEDEAVRCICASEDYPGRPPVEGPDADFFAGIELTEDVTGFFVQCDVCKVWQHGACVGIFSAESSPEEYFCEQCRKDLHKIHAASNGQKYSKYLPLHRPSRATSQATSTTKDGARSPKTGASKSSRPNSASQAAKRRSTMNSRDAAYDDELLRRVIEASKEDVAQDLPDNSGRRAKRGRSDSEERVARGTPRLTAALTRRSNGTNVKRQRTGSRSVSPPVDPPDANGVEGSDEEAAARNGAKKPKNNRVLREKSEKEEKERLRQEAASKRKGRAERRRAEGTGRQIQGLRHPADRHPDSDLSEEMPLAASKVTQVKSVEPPNAEEPPAATQPPGTPPTSHPAATNSHKRGARSNHKKAKGRNQYSKDRDADKEESPARSTSRDTQKNTEETLSSAKASVNEPKLGIKSKHAMASKMSMLDMKRRVAAIMEFISRTQVDLAAENGGPVDDEDSPPQAETAPAKSETTVGPPGGAVNGDAAVSPDDKDFKELNCIEMMDVLTRDMVKWQNQYAC